MMSRIFSLSRTLRRLVSRSEWMVRLFGLSRTPECADAPGLILVQIDGLSRSQMEAAMRGGRMPHLRSMLVDDDCRLRSFYSGLPSSTPAVQGELFYGERCIVPAFQFRDAETDELTDLMHPATAARVEERLRERCDDPLLDGGSAYSDIYTGGAAEPHFCASALDVESALRAANPLSMGWFLLTHALVLVRLGALLCIETALAVIDLFGGLVEREDFFLELRFLPKRLGVVILLRELVSAGVRMDAARGLPVIHCNFFGYDEQSHRRGPDSAFARWTLKGIDRAIESIRRAANRSVCRDYDVWVYSDHGQERTLPYSRLTGRSIQEAVAEVFREHGVSIRIASHERAGTTHGRTELLGRGRLARLLGRPAKGADTVDVRVAGMGPVGHVYPEEELDDETADRLARDLAENHDVPAVLFRRGEETVARTATARLRLPDDATALLGDDHPFPDDAGRDLVRLVSNEHAGRLVLLGWRPDDAPVTFVVENGAHAGPGREETRGFLVTPADAPLPEDREHVRPDELRRAGLRFLERPGTSTPSVAATAGKDDAEVETPPGAPGRLRIMTYNIHSCVGMDGRLSHRRLARVIARHAPDIVALQEVDACRARSDHAEQAREIAALLEMECHFHPSFRVEEEAYGNAFLSRLPFRVVRADRLPCMTRREPRSALCIEIDTPAGPLRLVNTHLGLRRSERLLQARRLLDDGWIGDDPPERCVLCGDLNAPPGSQTFAMFGETLADVAAGATRPLRTWMGVRRLDHIFVSPDIRVRDVAMPRSARIRAASDHYPLIADIELPPAE